MKKWLRFFGFVMIVILARDWVRLKNDVGYLVVGEKQAEYYYLSPERDRLSVIRLDLQRKKPVELDNLSWWLFYTYGLRTDGVFATNPTTTLNINFLREYMFTNSRLASLRDIDSMTDELVRRDFSDTAIDKMKLEVVIINATGINGLATRLSEILKMNGLVGKRVVTGNKDDELVCEVSGSKKYIDVVMKLPMDRCELIINDDAFVTLKVGAKAGKMVQYLLYGRSF